MNRRLSDITADMRALLNSAKAEARDLSADDELKLNALHAEALKAKAVAERAAKANSFLDAVRGVATDPSDPRVKAADPEAGGAPGTFGAKAVQAMAATGQGFKSLFTGAVDVPAQISATVTLPDVPNTLLDLIPRVPLRGGNTFEYLRQTVKDNKAAAVPDLATKPTSVYTFEPVEDKVHVYAHLSEELPIRFLGGNAMQYAPEGGDFPELARVLDLEMRAAVVQAVEADVVAGDGVEKIRGLFKTAGVRQQAFGTDAITTLRRAVTTLLLAGEVPTAWVLNPSDIEALELTRENGATGGFLLDADSIGRVTKVQVVPSVAIPAGQAVLADWRQAAIVVREDASSVVATQSGDMFERNACKVRTEGRYGAQFLRPGAFLVADLTA